MAKLTGSTTIPGFAEYAAKIPLRKTTSKKVTSTKGSTSKEALPILKENPQRPIKVPKKLPITIGCDPEFGLFDIEKNMYVSAHGLIPGTKAVPHKVLGGAIQVDGVMVEFNIDPASSAYKFCQNINSVMAELRKHLPENKYKFVFEPIIVYDKVYFESLPDSVKELGCSPDFNAWKGGGINQSPEPVPFLPTMRTCSGHIHIGWTEGADVTDPSHLWDCRSVIRMLDCFFAAKLDEIDPDRIRRLMYGKLGAFRPKSYGVEWRVPSNFWLESSSKQLSMFEAVHRAIEYMHSGNPIKIPNEYKSLPVPFFYNLSCEEPTQTKTRVPIGARVAPTSGRVCYDLNLDIPESLGGKYKSPPNAGRGLTDYVLL